MRRFLTAFVVLSVVWMLLPCKSFGVDRYRQPRAPLASIKFDPDCDGVLIPVRIGNRDYQFVLDTGATASVFDERLQSLMGSRVDSVHADTPNGGEVSVNLYNPPDAHVGSL